jgi:hypothetical protein
VEYPESFEVTLERQIADKLLFLALTYSFHIVMHALQSDSGCCLRTAQVVASVSTGKPFCHSRESGNATAISWEFPGSRELIFT